MIKLLKDMDEPEQQDLLATMLEAADAYCPEDVSGLILVVLDDHNMGLCASHIAPESVVQELRQLADRLEGEDYVENDGEEE